MLERITQSLAGRVAINTLLPFSISELRTTLPTDDDYIPHLFKGFFPRIYTPEIQPHDWYANYITTYIERDVRQIKNITNLHTFQQFLKVCAGRTGQLLNLSSIALDCGITHNTAKAWLSILEASHLVFLLRPSQKSFRKRLVKMPKLYIIDPGLLCSLLEIEAAAQIESHPLRGNIFESCIIIELLKYCLYHGIRPTLSFWRDKIGHEVDCLFEKKKELYAIEIKAGRTIANDFFSNLDYFSRLSSTTLRNKVLIYGGRYRQKREQGSVIPWSEATRFLD